MPYTLSWKVYANSSEKTLLLPMGITVISSTPPIFMLSVMDRFTLSPRFIMVTTDPTPITIPNRERKVLILLVNMLLKASLRFSKNIFVHYPSVSYHHL